MSNTELKTIINLLDNELSLLDPEEPGLLRSASPLLSLRNNLIRKFYSLSDFDLSITDVKILNLLSKINWVEVLE